MRVTLRCANPECGGPVTAGPNATCARCGRPAAWQGVLDAARPLATCPVCSGDELYVRKDFPQRLGLALVVIVALLSFWLFARGELLWSMGVLVALIGLDLAIYCVVPKITVCYRCRAEFRGVPMNEDHRGFDLATAEKYR